jgi:hypothetical protein
VTTIEDSSSPNGDDFPLPGFLADTPPNGSPEFHVKARSSRLGVNFAWLDPNPKWAITGRIEMDFEGNFNRSDNRNLSSIRSSNPSLRVAWGRLDYHFNDKNTFSALAGQDWTIYGSSTLANIVELTLVGGEFGGLWERDPQMRVGYTHKFNGFSVMPEFALDLPGSGLPTSQSSLATASARDRTPTVPSFRDAWLANGSSTTPPALLPRRSSSAALKGGALPISWLLT